MGRLGYRKSKNGCLRCKRRVKVRDRFSYDVEKGDRLGLMAWHQCDEQVPCTACKRHKVECSLERPGRGKPLETVSGACLLEQFVCLI